MERTEYWIRPGQGKAIALIHGIGANDPQAYWQDFLAVLTQDETLNEFGIFVWKYPTHVQPGGMRNALSTLKRKTLRVTAPRIALLGSAWSTTYHTQFQGYQDVFLVCHSMGGLVIKSWILETLEQGQSAKLATLRHIAFYATPHQGAPVTTLARWNNQLKDMHLDSPFIEDVGRRWYDHVVAWKERLPGPADERFNCYIPHLVLAGLNDAVVPSQYATIRGMSLIPITGDHSQVIQPIDSNDTRYKVWRTHLDETSKMISPKAGVSSPPDQQMHLEHTMIPPPVSRLLSSVVEVRRERGVEKHLQLFDVCVVCALPEEARAFLEIVQQQCEGALEERISPRYHSSYRFATLKNNKDEPLNLHVSWLPRYGQQEMTLHLSHVLEECQPRIAIMTGICAGDALRVQLGDLVVAERTFTYDNGKFTLDEQGRSVHLHDTMTYQLDANILQFLGLFDEWKPLVARLERPPSSHEQRTVACHLKAMASGSAVRADRPFADVQAPVRGTVAIDMEGAAFGLVMSRHPLIRWLIVKGVCDYADQNKNDVYHDYAARASALYALSFIRAYVTNERLPRPDGPSPSNRVGPSGIWNAPPSARFGAPFPEIWNVFRRHTPFFTGRAQVLQQLSESFQLENEAGIVPSQALTGLGGMGKTQTAAEYAYRFRGNYRAVLWIRAETQENLLADFKTIAGLLKLPQEHVQDRMSLVQTMKEWFMSQSDWLLIFDNADNPALVDPFLPRAARGHLLLTTRAGAIVEQAQPLRLEPLEPEDGALCILRRAGILAWNKLLQDAPAASVDAAHQLTHLMEGLPLALEQAGAYINDTECGVRRYLHLYQQYRSEIQHLRHGAVPDYPESVASAWRVSRSIVEQSNPAAAELLRLCAFLAPEAIPDELLAKSASALGPALESIAANPVALDQTIGLLRKYSLLHREADCETDLTRLSIHRVIQEILLDEMDESTQQLWAERAVRALAQALPTMPWPVLQAHARNGLRLIEQWQMTFPEAELLKNRVEEVDERERR